MKKITISTLSLLSLAAAQSALAANPCGTPAGTYTEVAPNQALTRIINRYKNANGYVYTYEIDLEGYGPSTSQLYDGLTYSLEIVLDGKSSITHGEMGCTTVSIEPFIDGRCIDPQIPFSAGPTITPHLFTYAANGDHLNVWEGQVVVLDPKTGQPGAPTKFSFPEKKFSEMNFQ